MVENAPLLSYHHAGLTIEGYSRAAVQSYWRIPELKIGFDLGAQPWDFMGTPTWLMTHTHLDHLAALPVYVARRRMMRMEPPTVYVPAEAVEDVRRLLLIMQRLDRGRMICTLNGLHAGDEIQLSRELVITAFATTHNRMNILKTWLPVKRRRKALPSCFSDSGAAPVLGLVMCASWGDV